MTCVNLKTGKGYVRVALSFESNITEDSSSDIFNVSLGEAIPIVLLVLEVVLGFIFNTVAIILYCNRRGLLQNAGNMFTVSLMAVDLLFCGFCVPLTIVIEFIKTSSFYQLNNLCLATRCFLMFSAIGSATGTTLLALDRGDISLRPSRRFFTGKRPLMAIIVTWVVSSAGLVIPTVVAWLYDAFTELTMHAFMDRPASAIQMNWIPNQSSLELLIESDQSSTPNQALCDTTCVSSCYKDQCTLTHTELAVRLGYQITIFILSGTITMAVYTKIIQSVHKRSFREEKKRGFGSLTIKRAGSQNHTKKILTRLLCCGHNNTPDDTGLVEMNAEVNAEAKRHSGLSLVKEIEKNSTGTYGTLTKSVSQIAKAENNRTEYNDEATKQPVVVVQSMEPSSNSVEAPQVSNCQSQINISEVQSSENRQPADNHKTDFASVALSITVVLALKRMVAAKVKRKQKKLKHLRRMTILIIVTFFVSWVPFHVLPMIKFFIRNTTNLFVICHATGCVGNHEFLNLTKYVSIQNSTADTMKSFWNSLFLWTLVFAAASSVVNPFLYSFSREKIRDDFKRTFCLVKSSKYGESKSCVGSKLRNRGGSAIWTAQWGQKRKSSFNKKNGKKISYATEKNISKSDVSKKTTIDKSGYMHNPNEPNADEHLLTQDVNENNSTQKTQCNSYQ